MSDWKSISDAARDVGISRITIGRWVKSGRLQSRLGAVEVSNFQERLVRLVELSAVRELVKMGVSRGRPSAANPRSGVSGPDPEVQRIGEKLWDFIDAADDLQRRVLKELSADVLEKIANICVSEANLKREDARKAMQRAARALNNRDARERSLAASDKRTVAKR